MARKTKYTKELVDAICQSIRKGANKRAAVIAAGISESTFYEWMNTKPEFSEKLEAAEQELIKTAEHKLYEQVQSGNIQAIQYLLKHRQQDIYTDKIKQEVSGRIDSDVNVTYELVFDSGDSEASEDDDTSE